MKKFGILMILSVLMIKPAHAASEGDLRNFYKEYGAALQESRSPKPNGPAAKKFIDRYYAIDWKSDFTLKVVVPGDSKVRKPIKTQMTRAQISSSAMSVIPSYMPRQQNPAAKDYKASMRLVHIKGNTLHTQSTTTEGVVTTVIDCMHNFAPSSPAVMKSEKCEGTSTVKASAGVGKAFPNRAPKQ